MKKNNIKFHNVKFRIKLKINFNRHKKIIKIQYSYKKTQFKKVQIKKLILFCSNLKTNFSINSLTIIIKKITIKYNLYLINIILKVKDKIYKEKKHFLSLSNIKYHK